MARRRWEPHPMAPASEEEWQRRSVKRHAAVNAVKNSQEYRALQQEQEQGRSHDAVPEAPDPDDRLTNKRRWEAKVVVTDPG